MVDLSGSFNPVFAAFGEAVTLQRHEDGSAGGYDIDTFAPPETIEAIVRPGEVADFEVGVGGAADERTLLAAITDSVGVHSDDRISYRAEDWRVTQRLDSPQTAFSQFVLIEDNR